jgi:hypothetical protein
MAAPGDSTGYVFAVAFYSENLSAAPPSNTALLVPRYRGNRGGSPGGVEPCPGTGFNGGKLLNPASDCNIFDTDPLGGPFFQFFFRYATRAKASASAANFVLGLR